MIPNISYTLAQHSGYAYGGKPAFKQAVEPQSVTTKQRLAVEKIGGMVFDGYADASDAAEAANYPPEVKGLIPHAKGSFKFVRGVGAVFIPAQAVAA